MRHLVTVASATLALVIGAGATPALAACSPATSAVQYLGANQKADGSLDMSSSGGFGNPGATMDFAMGAAAAGIDPGTIHKPSGAGIYDYLAAQAPSVTGDAGLTAKLLLALVAGDRPSGKFNYHSFGGQDLLAKLTSPVPGGFYHDTGSSVGAYGGGATFTQALAIMAVEATGGTVPLPAITWLKGLENQGASPDTQSTGFTFKGWSTASSSNSSQGDTNSTSIAIEALASVPDSTRTAAALAWLHTQQNSDGGFSFAIPCPFPFPGCANSDADSDALVVGALTATGQGLGAWTMSGNTPLSNLLTLQDAAGGFAAPTPDTFTTSQVPPALAGKSLPVTAVAVAGAGVPAAGCPVAVAAGVTASPAPAPLLPKAGMSPQPGPPVGPLVATLALLGALGGGVAVRRQR